MAHRKRIKAPTVPHRCGVCKEKKAYHTAHGHDHYAYGGATICDDCWKDTQQEVAEYNARNHDGGELANASIDRMLSGRSPIR